MEVTMLDFLGNTGCPWEILELVSDAAKQTQRLKKGS
jgi:hypothetical protein